MREGRHEGERVRVKVEGGEGGGCDEAHRGSLESRRGDREERGGEEGRGHTNGIKAPWKGLRGRHERKRIQAEVGRGYNEPYCTLSCAMPRHFKYWLMGKKG